MTLDVKETRKHLLEYGGCSVACGELMLAEIGRLRKFIESQGWQITDTGFKRVPVTETATSGCAVIRATKV